MSETGLTERLVNRLASLGRRKTSRRSFLTAATLGGAALAANPWGYLTRPQKAYASVCGPGAECGSGWSAMCCSINDGRNTCPPNTYPGGWWKADRSSFCNGKARYYIDCNAKPGYTFHCHCNTTNCDHRYVACNIFRYGQCNTQIAGVTAVVCRQISCTPPWILYKGHCTTSSRTDNNTLYHNAPCLNSRNTFPYPPLVTFADAPHALYSGHSLYPMDRLVSPDLHTEAKFGRDGNFVIRNENGVVWSTHTINEAVGGRVYLRISGRLVVLDANGNEKWSSGSLSNAGSAVLRLLNDGRLAIYAGGVMIWHTNTHTP